MAFNKRLYKQPGDFFDDMSSVFGNLELMNRIKKNEILSFPFRERLMLAVTSVNGCRYCSYYHTGQALKSGMDAQEIQELLSGEFAACPAEESPAVIYAQHWAECDGRPDADAVQRIKQAYGNEKADAIHLVLRMIRIGNMTGNTWDYLKYRLSFGKLK